MSAYANPAFHPEPAPEGCPFQHPFRDLCLASTRCSDDPGFVTSRRCATESYETCPLYLAKVLRGLRLPPGRPGGELRTK